MPRNPAWTRDELILALDLYFRVNPIHTSERNPEIQRLSAALNELPVHAVRPDGERFRNPNGVYMKLCNFLRLDPSYHGTGLTRGGRLEEQIWRDFAGNRDKLVATARAILDSRSSVSPEQVDAEVPSDDEFPEGRLLTAIHKRRERSSSAVRRKKETVLAATRRLACDACGFDFERVYGALGSGFAECHHTVPLSELVQVGSTRLVDLAVVCANCHRMIHRSRPMLTVSELKERLQDQHLDV